MTSLIDQRYHPRVSVQWPAVFFTPHVFGHGTVVDVSALAWRIRGSVPLVAGMHLAVRVWPQLPLCAERSGYFEIEEATVLWASEREFALEIYQVRAQDVPGMVSLQQQTLPGRLQALDNGQKPVIGTDPRLSECVVHEASSADTAACSERRTTGRLLAHCHIHYRRTDGHLGVLEEGLLRDLSLTGCHIITKAALQPGHRLTLVVYFNDGQLPITFPGTTVCWRRQHRFGLRFPEMTSDERTRLEAMIHPDTTVMAVCEPLVEPSGKRGHTSNIVLDQGRSVPAMRND
jgi:hypothetical protein